MKRLSIALVLMILTLPLVAAKPPSGGNGPLELLTDFKSIACNVEQQTLRWYGPGHLNDPCPGPTVVNNPTGCGWDIDDAWSLFGRGGISRGETVTASFCAIADGTHRAPVDAEVLAGHDRLIVHLDSSDGRSWSAVPIRSGNEYSYTMCADNLIQMFPHPSVPNSNGGEGTMVTYTLTIDAAARGASGVTALLKYGNGIWTVPECE